MKSHDFGGGTGMVVNEFDALLSDARRKLAEVARATADATPQPATATGADGRITVSMAADARLVDLTLDPAVLAMEAPTLAREIMTAVNRAWARRQGADDDTADAVAAVAAVDFDALQPDLAELQDRGLATMRTFNQSLQDTVARIERAASRW